MAKVILKNLKKVYPNAEKKKKGKKGEEVKKSNLQITAEGVVAVQEFNLEIADKEFIVLVGPSGCGKSTTLRMVAGLEEISDGELYIGDKLMNDVEPKDRDIAMVFQNYALYPHMTVYENMAFSLKLKKTPKDEIDRRVKEAAEILDITQYLNRKPKALSGGQRQRVAIGRAIVRNPKVFLMDEPLSNLDAKLRVDMRSELKRLHTETGTTMIYVTHDQVEALTMSTKIAIFREGIIIQVAPPLELYNNPANLYVADFIGNPRINFVDGKAEVSASGLTVNSVLGRMTFPADHLKDENMPQEASFDAVLGIRPEQIAINTSRQSPSDIEAHIYTSMPAGSETLVTVKVGGVSMVIKALGITHYNPDQVVYLSIDTTKINVFDKKTENLIKYSVE